MVLNKLLGIPLVENQAHVGNFKIVLKRPINIKCSKTTWTNSNLNQHKSKVYVSVSQDKKEWILNYTLPDFPNYLSHLH